MGLCSKRFGYESPALGAWCMLLSTQLALGVLFVLIGVPGEEWEQFLESTGGETSHFAAARWLGYIHVLLSLCVGAVIALGLFVSSCFLMPLCVISIIESMYCVGTGIFCFAALVPYYNVMYAELGLYSVVGQINPNTVLFSVLNCGYLVVAGALSFTCTTLFGKANSVKNDTPIPEVQLYIPCMALVTVTASLFMLGSGGVGVGIPLACVWFLAAIGMSLILSVAGCCCTPKVFNVVVGAGFAIVAILGFITCIMTTSAYGTGFTLESSGVHNADSLSNNEKMAYYLYSMMGRGKWLQGVCCTSLATAILGLYSAFYSVRSVLFCCGKGESG